MGPRRRLDVEMVRRGLVTTRAKAASVIEEGNVLVGGAVADKPSRLVAAAEPIELHQPPKFVSRGGLKLEAALDGFGVEVRGLRCLDAGASTGGFTDCLLRRGAGHVVAVDVGKGQLDGRLRGHPKVTVVEGVNVRSLQGSAVGEPPAVVVADLSFISLASVAPALAQVADDEATFIFLVKPQFEAGKARVGRGGIVRDPEVHRDVLREVIAALAGAGLAARGVMPSPIRGAQGNVEFLVVLGRGNAPTIDGQAIDQAVARAHEEIA